jgi:predicted component of type VI protein secretion system
VITYTLTLFDDANPTQELGTRTVQQPLTIVGRDANAADWVVEDKDRCISRRHLQFRIIRGLLFVRPLGLNGVYLGTPPQKLPDDVDVLIEAGHSLSFGKYRLEVSAADDRAEIVGSDLREAVLPSKSESFDAFCAGAQIDPSHFVAEDPAVLMKEAGAIYRQIVLGLGGLLRARSDLRERIASDRTEISHCDNNLIKWAPAQRLLIDLLINKEAGFIGGAAAVEASIRDLERHLVSVMAGHHSAMHAILDHLRPPKSAGRSVQRFFSSDPAPVLEQLEHAQAELLRELEEQTDGLIRQSFAEGYDRATHSAHRMRTETHCSKKRRHSR